MQSGILYFRQFSFNWFTTLIWSVVQYPLLNPTCYRGWFSSSACSSVLSDIWYHTSRSVFVDAFIICRCRLPVDDCVSRMISCLYVLMSSFAFLLIILHISACCIRCLLSPFSTFSCRFVIKTSIGDNILDFSGFSIALSTLIILC